LTKPANGKWQKVQALAWKIQMSLLRTISLHVKKQFSEKISKRNQKEGANS
jgi:hypothetical protein